MRAWREYERPCYTKAMKRKKVHSGGALALRRIPSPIGSLIAIASEKGLRLLDFADGAKFDRNYRKALRGHEGEVPESSNLALDLAEKEIADYFAGKLRSFSLPLDLEGSPFEMAVWSGLSSIGYGETMSYSALAALVGQKGKPRAVAGAVGRNRVLLVLPCHRVIGASGRLMGFGAGIERKEWLLRHEGFHLG